MTDAFIDAERRGREAGRRDGLPEAATKFELEDHHWGPVIATAIRAMIDAPPREVAQANPRRISIAEMEDAYQIEISGKMVNVGDVIRQLQVERDLMQAEWNVAEARVASLEVQLQAAALRAVTEGGE
jgi:hypothetical protein